MRRIIQQFNINTKGARLGATMYPSAVSGESGVWVDKTPSGVSLAIDVTGSPNWSGHAGIDAFGTSGMRGDPYRPGTAFFGAANQGVWKTTDFGDTFVKINTGTGGSALDGTSWSIDCAIDGTYMLANNGYGTNGGAYRSTDGGVAWSQRLSGDINVVRICPFASAWAVAMPHGPDDANAHFYLSNDSGVTWTDTGVGSPGIYGDGDWVSSTRFIVSSPHGVFTGDVNSVSSITFTSRISTITGPHGGFQIYHDVARGYVYLGGQDSGTGRGYIYRSANLGDSWTLVSDISGSNYGPATIFGTATRLYAQGNYAQHAAYGPISHGADAATGDTWSNTSMDAGMTNGAHSAAAMTDGLRWCVITASTNAGIWRRVE